MTALEVEGGAAGGRADGSGAGESFYFFDIDDNLLFLPTTIIITETETGEKKEVDTGRFAEIEPLLGKPGRWASWALGADAYVNFSDAPAAPICDSPFLRDIRRALDGDKPWKGPSWKFFDYACAQGRPTAYITARGHAPETILAGLALLAEAGEVARPPEALVVFPVGEPATRERLGGAHLTTPVLKRRAIRAAVGEALARHGAAAPHRFGMSDDDPRNVQLLIQAMRDCKADFPDKRFFVIDTHLGEHVKLEVFPIDMPAPRGASH